MFPEQHKSCSGCAARCWSNVGRPTFGPSSMVWWCAGFRKNWLDLGKSWENKGKKLTSKDLALNLIWSSFAHVLPRGQLWGWINGCFWLLPWCIATMPAVAMLILLTARSSHGISMSWRVAPNVRWLQHGLRPYFYGHSWFLGWLKWINEVRPLGQLNVKCVKHVKPSIGRFFSHWNASSSLRSLVGSATLCLSARP